MVAITNVALQQNGNPRPHRSFKKTTRRVLEFSNNRFVGQIKDNWLIVRGSGLNTLIDAFALKLTVDNVRVPTHVIELAAKNENELHVWFAAVLST